MWDEITYPPPNCGTVEVWEWVSNFIPRFTGHEIRGFRPQMGWRVLCATSRDHCSCALAQNTAFEMVVQLYTKKMSDDKMTKWAGNAHWDGYYIESLPTKLTLNSSLVKTWLPMTCTVFKSFWNFTQCVVYYHDGPTATQDPSKRDFTRIEIRISLGEDILCWNSVLGKFLYQQAPGNTRICNKVFRKQGWRC